MPRGGNRDSYDCIIFFLWHPLSADKLFFNFVAGQCPTLLGTEMKIDHTASQVQQTEWPHLWSHTLGCGREEEGARKVLNAHGPQAPPLNPAMLPPPSTSGSTGLCTKHWRICLKKAQTCWNSHETDPKTGQRGFLPAEKECSKVYGRGRKVNLGWGQGTDGVGILGNMIQAETLS